MRRIVVVDYGMGNLRSVAKALERVSAGQCEVCVSADPRDLATAERVVFPGQGAARDCMRALREHGLVAALTQAAQDKPFLGICMGLQILLEYSEENGGTECLGLLPGRVRAFPKGQYHAMTGARLKIPHMGWNRVQPTRPHPLWAGIEPRTHFYFVHGYYVEPREAGLVAATTDHGLIFASAIAKGHLFALQCHPEKSGNVGLTLLTNFVHWDGQCG